MSSINPNNIDGTYPIAGQDNDSQGFRDNFTNIKNNFTFASTEITDLQNNAILKSALSGTTLNNNMNNAQLIGAQISRFTQTRNDIGSQSGAVTVNWTDAHFQTLEITGYTTLTLANWPTSGFWTDLVLDVTPSTDNLVLAIPSCDNQSTIQGFSGGNITLPTGNVTYRFQFSTYDSGSTVSIRDMFRNYSEAEPARYQIYKPTGNVSIQANVNVDRVVIAPTPAGSITSFWTDVILPNTFVDGTTISISSNVQIETFRVLSPWVGTTVDPSANVTLANNTPATYLYHSADSKWIKV